MSRNSCKNSRNLLVVIPSGLRKKRECYFFNWLVFLPGLSGRGKKGGKTWPLTGSGMISSSAEALGDVNPAPALEPPDAAAVDPDISKNFTVYNIWFFLAASP